MINLSILCKVAIRILSQIVKFTNSITNEIINFFFSVKF